MSNIYKSCGCRACKSGRRRNRGKETLKTTKRKLRHKAKIALKQGQEPERVISTPYTD